MRTSVIILFYKGTVVLRLNKSLAEMSTRNPPGDKGHLAPKTDNFVIFEVIVEKMWEIQ
jgi:hypothetical protein